MEHGSVYRRCGCRDEATGRLLGARCPSLGSPGHGSWYFSADLPSVAGRRRRVRRGGFVTQTTAAAALEALESPAARHAPDLGPRCLSQDNCLLRLAIQFCGRCNMDDQFDLGTDVMIRGLDRRDGKPGR